MGVAGEGVARGLNLGYAEAADPSGSVTSATTAPSAVIASSAPTITATPWPPAPSEISRPRTRSSATTGHAWVEPNGVIVPRS